MFPCYLLELVLFTSCPVLTRVAHRHDLMLQYTNIYIQLKPYQISVKTHLAKSLRITTLIAKSTTAAANRAGAPSGNEHASHRVFSQTINPTFLMVVMSSAMLLWFVLVLLVIITHTLKKTYRSISFFKNCYNTIHTLYTLNIQHI
jgi:hypothetical protein